MSATDWSWLEQAACRGLDPQLFLAERHHPEDAAAAKRICNDECPVQAECCAWALVHYDANIGIAGGLSAQQRRQMRKLLGVERAHDGGWYSAELSASPAAVHKRAVRAAERDASGGERRAG